MGRNKESGGGAETGAGTKEAQDQCRGPEADHRGDEETVGGVPCEEGRARERGA